MKILTLEMWEEAEKLQERTDYMLNSALLQVKQYKERLEELEQPDDTLLRIGAPAVPFLEQVEWMRNRLVALEEAARPFLEFYDDMDTHAMREAQKRLAELLEKGN